MNHTSSNLEIYQMLTAFGSAVDGCVINRYDWQGFTEGTNRNGNLPVVNQKIRPWFRYAGKPRAIHEAINPAGTTKFPYITYVLNSLSHDPNRNTNKNADMVDTKWRGSDGVNYVRKPTPINLDVSVHIGTKKKSDMEQILTHYISICNPEFYISWAEPLTGNEIQSKVTWSGSGNMGLVRDLPAGDDDTFTSELQFTIEGWIYVDVIDKAYPVKKIEYNIGVVDETNCTNFYADSETQEFFDTQELSSEVTINRIIGDCVSVGDYVYVEGNMISDIEGVYITNLSGDVIHTDAYNPFCWSESLSADCPEFQGLMIEEYDVLDNNTIRFEIPEQLDGMVGNYDVIATNRWCGCVSINKDEITKNTDIRTVV